MKGMIDRIFENTTKKKTPYWVLSIGGENYSVWDKKFMEGLHEGAMVEYEWAASGDFKKVTDIKKVEMEPNFERPGKSNSRDQQIIRMSCIKSAVVLTSSYDKHPNDRAEITLGIARNFEKYITENEEEGSTQGKRDNEKRQER